MELTLFSVIQRGGRAELPLQAPRQNLVERKRLFVKARSQMLCFTSTDLTARVSPLACRRLAGG